jgi:lipopolysaccharide transport system permease protein
VLAQSPSVPDGENRLPSRVIVEAQGRFRVGVAELWHYRELLFFLTWRDIKVRYKQTALGAMWAVLQPLLMMVIFSIFLGAYAHVPSDGRPYPLFALAGLVPWTLFSQSLNGASSSLVDNANLVSKVYFPRFILPLAPCGAFLLDFLISLVVLFVAMFAYGVPLTPSALSIVPMTICILLAAFGAGLWLAALNVRYRDVRHAVPFLLQAWLFATPVAYPSTLVPAHLRWAVALNPAAGAIDWFRSALLGLPIHLASLLISLASTTVILLGGLLYFRTTERSFADWI